MRLELHCHSTHSDGSRPAHDVAEQAAKFGVEVFCLTDHDTDAGYEATRAAFEGGDATVLRGMELSCREHERTVHLLVLGLREGPGLAALHERIDQIQLDRRDRIRRICERLRALGFAIDPEPIVAAAEGRTPGRPDVARALVQAGVCSSPQDAFTRFLRDGGPADVPLDRLSVGEGVALAKAAGGKVSLAHPHTLGEFALVESMMRRHRDDGLEGIEALYGKYAQAESIGWLRLARRYDLVITAGSDYHGDLTPDVPHPGVRYPVHLAGRLRRWLELD